MTPPPVSTYALLPSINAALNATSALLLMCGYIAIRNQKVSVHRLFMTTAFIVSTIFLISYLTYHAHAGHVPYQGTGLLRMIYFTILLSHTILAMVIVPLILRTIYLALRGRFDLHRQWARWTFPLWLYVSITGVVIYEMLY